jgi:L-ascorbate metabolism protein UlaG (beta-lactamase superfamily)
MITGIIVSFTVAGILGLFIFLKFYPAFGGKTSRDQLRAFRQSPNFNKHKFVYPIPTKSFDSRFENWVSLLRDYIKGNPKARPSRPLPVMDFDLAGAVEPSITWFGHSALLLRIEGKTILLDPMLGRASSPFPMFGSKRYSASLPVEIEKLPPIDAVILSHDHYDHLDYSSIKKLKDMVGRFIVPLGVGSHLKRWGIDPNRISEHDWWDEFHFQGLTLACTPARHFSGRSLLSGGKTLWCSWVIAGEETKVYFSGDSGYGNHFKQIGEKYGPFDLTLMECGQYDERWSDIHLMPEQTVQAHLDVNGGTLIPIHWSAFTLALHDWTDPIDRVTNAAFNRNVNISTPMIGETVLIGSGKYPSANWWR